MSGGRPNEGRVKMTIHVLPVTAKRITCLVDKKKRSHCTQGRVVDAQFGVQVGVNVAGRGRCVPEGRDGRKKPKLSRAKRDNEPSSPTREEKL